MTDMGCPVFLRLHKNFVQQWVPNNVYDFLRWTHYGMQRDPHWNMTNQNWVPPAGLIRFNAQIWVQSGAAAPGAGSTFVVKMLKNNDPDQYVATGIGAAGTQPGTVPIQIAGTDYANGTDTYYLAIYATAANGVNSYIDGHPAHTFFCGEAWPD